MQLWSKDCSGRCYRGECSPTTRRASFWRGCSQAGSMGRSVLVEAGRWSRSPSRNTEPTVFHMSIAGLLAALLTCMLGRETGSSLGRFRWCSAAHAARKDLTTGLASWVLAIEVCGIPGRDLPPLGSSACSCCPCARKPSACDLRGAFNRGPRLLPAKPNGRAGHAVQCLLAS